MALLRKLIGEELSALEGTEVIVKQLQTSDAFLVLENECVSAILRDNDTLRAVDMAAFMQQEYK